MYKTYVAQHGAEDWIEFSGLTYSALATWDDAFKNSPTIDPTDVMNSMYSLGQINHSIYGKSNWSGKEIYGVDHHLLTPTPKYVVSNGEFKLSGVTDDAAWWSEHGAAAYPVLKEAELTET